MSAAIDNVEAVFARAERMLTDKTADNKRLRLNVCDVIALLDAEGACSRCRSAANYLRRALMLNSQPSNPFAMGGE